MLLTRKLVSKYFYLCYVCCLRMLVYYSGMPGIGTVNRTSVLKCYRETTVVLGQHILIPES